MRYRGNALAILVQAAALLGGLAITSPAYAYVGPGAGLTAIGSLVALLAAVGLAVVGFVWYPVTRLRRRRKEARKPAEGVAEKPAG